MSGRVLVPWDAVSVGLAGLDDGSRLTVEVFSGEAPAPHDLDDVVFFTVPYDQPFGLDPMERLPNVKVVQGLTAGYDHLLPLLPKAATLCNARGLHDAGTAEHALGLILAAQRELPRWVRTQDRGVWEHDHTRSLAGSRVLIVGYGAIGAALDVRLAACEAETIRVASRPRPAEHVRGPADLDALLPDADIVVLVTPLNSATLGLLDARRLALLPDGALVVNVGRGPVLDAAALLAETTSGRLRAALDVTDPEPLPDGHPLWSAPNVIITPHVAGGAADFYPKAAAFIADQVRRFASGTPLANVVAGPNSLPSATPLPLRNSLPPPDALTTPMRYATRLAAVGRDAGWRRVVDSFLAGIARRAEEIDGNDPAARNLCPWRGHHRGRAGNRRGQRHGPGPRPRPPDRP